MEEQRLNIPFIPMKGICIMPGTSINFDVSGQESAEAVQYAFENGKLILLITQRHEAGPELTMDDLYNVGTVAKIRSVSKITDKGIRIAATGLYRGRIQYCAYVNKILQGMVSPYEPINSINNRSKEEQEKAAIEDEARLRELKEMFSKYIELSKAISPSMEQLLRNINKLNDYIVQIIPHIHVGFDKKQNIMECLEYYEQYDCLVEILRTEIQILEIKNELQTKLKMNIDKTQKEYVLREQQKMIQEELGEGGKPAEASEFSKSLEELEADEEVKEHISKEVKRFQQAGPYSAETAVLRTYIETLLTMPWKIKSGDNTDLKHAAQVLDEDHYGLTKVKERILEFLAVRALNEHGDSPIICLVGPPGTGKTSIAKSVARALEKKFIRISLGGVRDEAEIRGHRKTYVGAMPGRIVAGIKSVKVKNPLMLLDEIDKTSSDYKGDTASALLEVLDGEQNSRFTDHYLEIPFDLSEVLFIATANSAANIPRPLLDRMELIEINSYTANEKFHIAREHLIKKQLISNGLTDKQLEIGDDAIYGIISGYTREAGVRQLERCIGQLCRKTARKILDDRHLSIYIGEKELEENLGRIKYPGDELPKTDEPGIVRGLAWTSFGGDTLEIEVNVLPGKGELLLTGQMGDVMKESAQAGISYVRSVADKYKVKPDFFKEHDIHVHIPEGAVPKDGPSAGITMTTAILSAIIKEPVVHTLAMTGEITLRGRVLPVGGLKEKILAAKTIGITKVLVPAKNRANIEEIEPEITDGIAIVYVSSMEDVLKEAFIRA